MSDKTEKKEETTPKAEESKTPSLGDFLAFQAYGKPAYKTDPRMGYGYYSQTTQPARTKSLATAAGISGAGAVAESIINAQRMFDPALEYAERELAEAEALQREPAPKMTEEEKQEIRAGALAAPRAEVAEIKSDVGALMASRGGATVSDLLKVREAGVEKLATAGLEAESKIAKQDVKLQEAHEKKIAAAQKRADTMTQTAFDARQEGRDNWANLASDLTTIAVKVAAEWPEEDERPALDRMVDAGIPMEKITPIHEKAVKSGFWPGTRGYDHYMMSHFDDLKPEGEKRQRAEVPELKGTPAKLIPPPPAAPKAGDTWKAKEGTATLLENGEVRVVAEGRAPTTFSGDKAQYLIKQWKAPAPAAVAQGDTELDQAKAAWLKAEQAVNAAKKAADSPESVDDVRSLQKALGEATQARVRAEDAYKKLWTKANPDRTFDRKAELAAAAAPAAAEGEGAKVVFADTTKFWADKTQEDSNNFRTWVRETHPEVTKPFKLGAMQTADSLGPTEKGTTQKGWPPTPENNATFAEVWKKYGKQYVDEVLNKPPGK